jgi:hypothetical protein
VENACELLAWAHLHSAAQLKAHALVFIKGNAASVMKSEGWAELIKNAQLVNYVFGRLLAVEQN